MPAVRTGLGLGLGPSSRGGVRQRVQQKVPNKQKGMTIYAPLLYILSLSLWDARVCVREKVASGANLGGLIGVSRPR
jgi:hypothetical protein